MKTFKINILLTLLLFCGFAMSCIGQTKTKSINKNQQIKLTINYPSTTSDDTLTISWSDDLKVILTDPYQKRYQSQKAARTNDGTYNFLLPASKTGLTYVFLRQMKKRIDRENIDATSQNSEDGPEMLPNYIFMNGDDLKMQVNLKGELAKRHGYRHNFSYKFRGKGALMQNLWFSLDSIAYNVNADAFFNKDSTYNIDNYENGIIPKSFELLNQFKSTLSELQYGLLLSHAIFSAKKDEGFLISRTKEKVFKKFTSIQKAVFLRQYDSTFSAHIKFNSHNSLELSKDYPEAEFYRKILHAQLSNAKDYNDSLYAQIRSEYPGLLRDQLLLIYFDREGKFYPGAIKNLPDAQTLAASNDYKNSLFSITYAPGQKAFNFDLPDSSGKRIHLADFKNKTVFIDFWYTGCENCMGFYKDQLSKVEEYFKGDSQVVFISISIDRQKPFWLKSIKSGNYTSLNVINLFTEGQGGKSEVTKYYGIYGYPQPMLISKGQNILASDESLRSSKTTIKEILLAKQRSKRGNNFLFPLFSAIYETHRLKQASPLRSGFHASKDLELLRIEQCKSFRHHRTLNLQ